MLQSWCIAPEIRTRHQAAEIAIGAWGCHGRVREWAVERAGEVEILLQDLGAHALRRGPRRSFVAPGAITLFGAGEEYLRNSPTPAPQRSTHIYVRAELAEALAPAREVTQLSMSADVALVAASLRRARDPLELHERAIALVATLLPTLPGARPPALPSRASWRPLVETAQHALATQYRQPLSLEALAQRCGTSAFHLARVFRAVTGDSIHRSLLRIRLRAALVALDDGPRDLGALALGLGFASHAHFTDAFRREYGVPPSRLRAARGSRYFSKY